MGGEKSTVSIPNLKRGLQVMELLASHPKGLTRSEIASHLGIPGNSAYRITLTLLEQGYLIRSEVTKAFCLTSKMMSLHCQAIDEFSLAERSWEVMGELRDELNESIMLTISQRTRGVLIESVTGPGGYALTFRKGHMFDLNAGAPGKIFLAFMDIQDQLTLLNSIELHRFTDNTITSIEEFKKEVQEVATKGYAIDNEEALVGIKCVAVPIFNRQNRCVGSLVTSTFSHRLPDNRIESIACSMKNAANKISQKL